MPPQPAITRRSLLAGTAATLCLTAAAQARTVDGRLPWAPNAGDPPKPVQPGPWTFFTPEEGAAMEAIADRIIPPDPHIPGGKDAGCAIYIDRQLAGAYGRSEGLYMRPPFFEGTKEQGLQGPDTPAMRYCKGLAALDAACRAANPGKAFRDLDSASQDAFLARVEKGELKLDGTNGAGFFELLLTDTKQGFLTDPVYGGNRGMAGWRMIGFPGARYDYSDWILRHNERYPLPPVSIDGRAEWQRKT